MEFAVNDHKTLKSRSYYESGTFYTFHYTIELTDDYKYLIIITPSLGDSSTGKKLNVVYKVAHTKGNYVGYIFLIIFIVFILIAILVCVIYCIKRKRANEAYFSNFPKQALTQ